MALTRVKASSPSRLGLTPARDALTSSFWLSFGLRTACRRSTVQPPGASVLVLGLERVIVALAVGCPHSDSAVRRVWTPRLEGIPPALGSG